MVAVTGTTTRESWRNWAGNQVAAGVRVAHPESTDEIAALVRAAAHDGRRVKAVGSGHSFTAISRPEDVAITLDGCDDLQGFDEASGRVTIGAGASLHDLSITLAAHGRALTNLGDIDVQTVAGAIATGTHGTGALFGGIATQVTGLEIVIGDGSQLWCSASRRPDIWSAARVNLGALGVVTSVELDTVPLFALAAVEGSMRLDELLADWDAHFDGADHFEAYWFPHTGMVSTKRNTRVGLDHLDPLPRWREWVDDSFLQNTVFGGVVAAGRRLPRVIPTANRLAARALGARCYTDLSYRVFATERRVRFCEMEYAIPRVGAVEVVRALTDAIERSGMRIAFPVELRVAAADDIPLSTANGRDSAYVAVHMPAGVDHRAYFSLVAGILDDAGGRPHWGKLHGLDAEALRLRYPRWDDFAAVRHELDPDGLFANGELERVLGPA